MIRDVYIGINRFDDLQRDLGISRKVLAERLRHLVDAGVLERRPYSERPPRHEYVLTEMGSEFMDVLMAMVALGRPLDRGRGRAAGPLPPPRLRRDRARRAALLGVRRGPALDRRRRRARAGVKNFPYPPE